MSHCIYHPSGLPGSHFRALLAVVCLAGRHWRSWLREAWERGGYTFGPGVGLDAELHALLDELRDSIGPEGLDQIVLSGPVAAMEAN